MGPPPRGRIGELPYLAHSFVTGVALTPLELTSKLRRLGDHMPRATGAFVAIGIGVLAVGIGTPIANADEFTVCPSGMTGTATADTSCAFAENVRAARIAQSGAIVDAYSPVTQQSYAMQCAPTVTDSWPNAERCVGANSAGVALIVFINTASSASGSGQSSNNSGQLNGSAPSGGVGVGVDSPNVPSVNGPNVGCTWVNGYTKGNGTRVSGYWRC